MLSFSTPEEVVLKPKASLNRCDQCANKRKGCDRRIPKCDNCVKSNLNCTYSRKLQRNKLRSLDMDQNSFSFRIEPVSKKKSITVDDISIERGISIQPSVLNIIQQSFKNAPRRYRLINLLTLLQFPDLHSNNHGMQLFLNLSKLLSDDRGIVHANYHPLKMFKINLPRLPIILNQAKLTFLRNPNLFSAVTIESIYLRSKPSKLLKYAVYLSGLLLMESDPFIASLIDNFTAQIQSLLSLKKLKVNLNTIQAIVILLMGINNIGFINKMQYTLASIALNMSYCIGLHLYIPNLNPKLQLQRMLTFNALLFYINFSPLMTNILLMYEESFIKNNSLNYYLNQFYNLPLNDLPLNKTVEVCSIHFNCCLSYFNTYLFELSKLKEYIIDSNNNQVCYSKSKKLIDELLNNCSFVLQKLYHLKANLIDPEKLAIVQVCVDAIAFRCHYFKFFNLSMQFYQPINYSNSTIIHNIDKMHIMNQSLEACVCVLEYGINLNLKFNFYGSVGMTSACYIFILRNLNQLNKQNPTFNRLMDVLDKGRLHFQKLKQVRFQAKLATLNLDLFDKIAAELDTRRNPKLIKKQPLQLTLAF